MIIYKNNRYLVLINTGHELTVIGWATTKEKAENMLKGLN